MKNLTMVTVPLLGLYLLTSMNVGWAQGGIALGGMQKRLQNETGNHSGWYAYAQVITGGYTVEGLANNIDKNERIASLNASANAYDEGLIMILGRGQYTFANGKTSIFAGVPENGIIEDDAFLELGVSHELSDGTVLSTSYVPGFSELYAEVWQDPYRVGERRQRSETSTEALRIAGDYIFGSPLSFRYEYGETTIETDRAGQSQSASLTMAQIDLLRRDSTFHRARITFTLPLSENFYLIPGAYVIKVDAQGEANSRTVADFELTLFYQQSHFNLFAYFYSKNDEYKIMHPLFNVQREDDGHGMSVGGSYLDPFGWKHASLDFIISSNQKNSNIHFFDMQEEFLAFGMSYSF